MWMMLQQDAPEDFVVASGRTISVRTMCRIAFAHVGLDYEESVMTNSAFRRPAEVDVLLGDASKAKEELGWQPEVTFEALIAEMVDADLARHRKRMQ
jgi:GDPmannose 4,6-dehydratase